MAVTLQFVDAVPEAVRARTRKDDFSFEETFQALRQNPGRWAIVEGFKPKPYHVAEGIRTGAYAGEEEGEFEAVVRLNQVYARYQPRNA